jgi:hypothetical protein
MGKGAEPIPHCDFLWVTWYNKYLYYPMFPINQQQHQGASHLSPSTPINNNQ